MSFSKWIFISGFLFIILYLFSKKGTVLSKVLFVLAIFAFLGSFYLPGVIFGTWNSIKSLKGKEVHNIFLQPSIPDWPANLTDSLTVISDTSQIAYILDLLKKTEAYFLNHPIPIWETNMILITKENDSLSLRISKTENNGTVIYSPDNELRKDELGSYLEKVTNFTKPSVMKKE